MAVDALVRPATLDDVAALTELERLAFAESNWPAETFLRYDCTVAEVGSEMAGFLVSRQTYGGSLEAPPEREILNLAVSPTYRRTGIATLLIQLEFQKNASFILEVRESNGAARALYESLGFVEISRRHNYYDNPPETAIVMQVK